MIKYCILIITLAIIFYVPSQSQSPVAEYHFNKFNSSIDQIGDTNFTYSSAFGSDGCN